MTTETITFDQINNGDTITVKRPGVKVTGSAIVSGGSLYVYVDDLAGGPNLLLNRIHADTFTIEREAPSARSVFDSWPLGTLFQFPIQDEPNKPKTRIKVGAELYIIEGQDLATNARVLDHVNHTVIRKIS